MPHTFDFYRIFIGDQFNFYPMLEILFRTTFMYVYTVINVRLMDKRSMGQISSFEIIIIIALGTSVGDSMFYSHIPLLQAMIAITTIVFMEKISAAITEKSDLFELFIVGRPAMIIRNGKILEEALEKQSLSKEELYSFLRLKGVRNIGDVEYAFIEPSGGISVLLSQDQKGNGNSTLP